MYQIKETKAFSKWLLNLKDIRGKVTIIRRIKRIKLGNFGDHKFITTQVSELRITVGPGYRIYYTKQENKIIILLVGGDKSSQRTDIEKAIQLAKEYHDKR